MYGAAIWNLEGKIKQESDLRIFVPSLSNTITVDGLETSQFFSMIIENAKISKMMEVANSKVILILGRFKEDRKIILLKIKELLLAKDYIPILFDFDGPDSKTTGETIRTLANLSNFIIADITEATSVLQELQSFVESYPYTPVVPILLAGSRKPSMWDSFESYPWVLDIMDYNKIADIPSLVTAIIRDATKKRTVRIEESRRKKGC